MTNRRHITEGGEEQEGIILKRKWEELRPRVIRPLGKLFLDARIHTS